MTEHVDRPVDIERRIARAQAARTPVDSQGTPTGTAPTFHYDERGLLVRVEPGELEDPVRYTYDGRGQVTGHTGGDAA